MQHINVTVQKIDSSLHLFRGKPEQIGVQAVTAHILFDHDDLELEVWIIGNLSNEERQLITQSGLAYLDTLGITPIEGIPNQETAPKPTKTPIKRVLIVDDEEFTLDVFQTFLELSGYQVITTVNSDQAVRLVEQEHPDCVLLDVMMPGMDGFTLCKLIRSKPEIGKVPIIFCTAYAALDVEDRRKASGGDLVIMKPFEMNTLVGAIESMTPPQPAQPVVEQKVAMRPRIKQTTMLGSISVSLPANATTEACLAALQRLVTGG